MSLDRLLGTWTFAMRHVAMPEPVEGEARYERVLSNAFVLLTTTYEHLDFPDAIAMLDETRLHYFDVRGVTRVFDLCMSHDGWAMLRRDADFWQRSAVTIDGSDAMTGTGENSYDDGANWEHDFSISYVRSA